MSDEAKIGSGVIRPANGLQHTGARLRADLEAKHAAFLKAVSEFDQFCKGVQDNSLGMSFSDGQTALTTLSQRARASLERYRCALHALTAFTLNGSRGYNSAPAVPVAREPRVTEREMQVLRQLAEGKTTKEIARDLNIAFKTALTHRSHLLQKFDANNVARLVAKAIQQGYIE